MRCSDGTGMLLCIAAEILLVAAVLFGSSSPEGSADTEDVSSAAETTVTTTVSLTETTCSTTRSTTTTTAAGTTTSASSETSVTAAETTAETTAASSATTTLPRVLSDVSVSTQYGAYDYPEDTAELLSDTVFVGDSITLGLKYYGFVPADHVLARGGVGIRNVLEQHYTVMNQTCDLLEALALLHPKYVSFAFGMNDLHMGPTELYCENYRKVLTAVREVLPDAQLFVIPTTPVLSGISFTTNDIIDSYNAALSAFAEESGLCTYIDITPEMKNQWNSLKDTYQSGDGIHLTPKGYAPYLWQISVKLHEVRQAEQEETAEETTETAETTVSGTE